VLFADEARVLDRVLEDVMDVLGLKEVYQEGYNNYDENEPTAFVQIKPT